MEKKRYIFVFVLILAFLPIGLLLAANSNSSQNLACPMVKIEAERIADLNTPRAGFGAFRSGEEITIVGGHIAGYKLTATAEYYSEGKWHQLPTVYNHDGGITIPQKSGKVLLAGGFEQNLGIGHTYEVEMYDPKTHTFNGFGCLDKKRALGRGVELENGQTIISGNWHEEDWIEVFDGKCTFSFLKKVSSQRTMPYIFRTSPDNAIILSGEDINYKYPDSIVVDRVNGESFTVPLLNIWHPMHFNNYPSNEESFIGNEDKGIYAYLMPVKDKSGRIAIVKVQGLDFSLLPTSCPVPTETKWGQIDYFSQVIVDRQTQCGYMVGRDKDRRCYVLCIEYGKAIEDNVAPLTLYYTSAMPEAGNGRVILTADGDLMLIGGILDSNFAPFGSVFIFPFGSQASENASTNTWVWGILTIIVLLAFAFVIILFLRKHRQNPSQQIEKADEETEVNPKSISVNDDQLSERIFRLLEDQKLYLNSELKVSDIADMLGTNRRYISDCINAKMGQSFTQIINNYRIDYAKRLLKSDPEIKITEVYLKSGFANETTFFRVFKNHTGITPTQYKNKNG